MGVIRQTLLIRSFLSHRTASCQHQNNTVLIPSSARKNPRNEPMSLSCCSCRLRLLSSANTSEPQRYVSGTAAPLLDPARAAWTLKVRGGDSLAAGHTDGCFLYRQTRASGCGPRGGHVMWRSLNSAGLACRQRPHVEGSPLMEATRPGLPDFCPVTVAVVFDSRRLKP